MDEESELAQVTRWLQRLTGDPMADAVPGRLRVLTVSEPGRGRYQECAMTLAVEAAGIPPVTLEYRAVFPRRRWPRAGMVVPARISRIDPSAFEADWDAQR